MSDRQEEGPPAAATAKEGQRSETAINCSTKTGQNQGDSANSGSTADKRQANGTPQPDLDWDQPQSDSHDEDDAGDEQDHAQALIDAEYREAMERSEALDEMEAESLRIVASGGTGGTDGAKVTPRQDGRKTLVRALQGADFDPLKSHDFLLWALKELGAKVKENLVQCPFHSEPSSTFDGSIRESDDGTWLYSCPKNCNWNERNKDKSAGNVVDVIYWGLHRYRDPKNLMRNVERAIRKFWGHPKNVTLRWWRDELWEWNGCCYRSIRDKEISARVLKWIGGWDAKASPTKANNIVKGLHAHALVPGQVEQPVWIDEDGSIKERHLIAMKNGLLDLDVLLDGKPNPLEPNSPRWFSPVALGYDYDPKCECPKWLALLDRCLEKDQERIDLLQEWFGYCLTHDTTQQKAMFWEGDGANGKSVAALTLEQVVGPDNTSSVPLEVFGDRFQLTATLGKLVNICGDTGELDKADEGFIKQFTGGDKMYFDRKGISSIETKPTARLLIATNNLPRFSDRSDGIWRRIILIPWRVTIREKDQNKLFLKAEHTDWPLRPELPGIFNWAIEGLKRLRERGHFMIPEVCRDAVNEYRMESDHARAFLTDEYRAKPGARVFTTEVYRRYEQWCKERGYKPLGDAEFGKVVKRCFPKVEKKRETTGKRDYYYDGLALIEDPS